MTGRTSSPTADAGDPVRPDAQPVPSIAQQLRADRYRRDRRRRVTLGVLAAVAAAVVATRLLAGATAEPASAMSPAGAPPPTVPAATSEPTQPPARGLHPGLVDAFERAQAGAADAGHRLTITSGFRTAAEQARLLDAEVAKRGSLEEALWWVFPPDRSMHVQGLAIDVGDGPAADWLADAGVRFGLCRTLGWEWWHFEWRERWEAPGACPAPAQVPDDAPPA